MQTYWLLKIQILLCLETNSSTLTSSPPVLSSWGDFFLPWSERTSVLMFCGPEFECISSISNVVLICLENTCSLETRAGQKMQKKQQLLLKKITQTKYLNCLCLRLLSAVHLAPFLSLCQTHKHYRVFWFFVFLIMFLIKLQGTKVKFVLFIFLHWVLQWAETS